MVSFVVFTSYFYSDPQANSPVAPSQASAPTPVIAPVVPPVIPLDNQAVAAQPAQQLPTATVSPSVSTPAVESPEPPKVPIPVIPDEPPLVTTREWSTADGKFKVKADFVTKIGDKVKLRRADDGREISVPFDRLSLIDQQWITSKK